MHTYDTDAALGLTQQYEMLPYAFTRTIQHCCCVSSGGLHPGAFAFL
jgi:hypothetical protein